MRNADYTDTAWRPWHTCIIGAAHRRDLANCQDATAIREGNYLRPRSGTPQGRFLVGVVADGVGSLSYSEAGARVTASAAASIAFAGLLRGDRPDQLEARLARGLPVALGKLADICGEDWSSCCYSTVVIAVGTRDWFAVWACGDGFYSVNGGAPRYTGVTMKDRLPVDYRYPGEEPRPPMLTRLAELPAREVQGAWIATDGARYLTADGKTYRGVGHDSDPPLEHAPPVLAGWAAMEAWSHPLYTAARGEGSRLRDDLGLVAFVPR